MPSWIRVVDGGVQNEAGYACFVNGESSALTAGKWVGVAEPTTPNGSTVKLMAGARAGTVGFVVSNPQGAGEVVIVQCYGYGLAYTKVNITAVGLLLSASTGDADVLSATGAGAAILTDVFNAARTCAVTLEVLNTSGAAALTKVWVRGCV